MCSVDAANVCVCLKRVRRYAASWRGARVAVKKLLSYIDPTLVRACAAVACCVLRLPLLLLLTMCVRAAYRVEKRVYFDDSLFKSSQRHQVHWYGALMLLLLSQHDNAALLGACVDHSQICIVTELQRCSVYDAIVARKESFTIREIMRMLYQVLLLLLLCARCRVCVLMLYSAAVCVRSVALAHGGRDSSRHCSTQLLARRAQQRVCV
jgi:hypothetical protein